MPESASGEVALRVTAGSPLAEIFLIDGQFELVARSVGDLVCRAAPGVYKVKARLSDATVERLVLIEADQALDLAGDLVVTSPVPMSRGPRPPRLLAVAATPDSRVRAGQEGGAELFLMTRGGARSPASAPQSPGISVHRLDGSTVASLEPGSDGRSSMVEVSPGPYLVRRRDRFGDDAEQCVHAVAGWQTQVFTLDTGGSSADLGGIRVSVLMAQQGSDPPEAERRLVEEARTALADKRKVATEAVIALVEQVDNPVLSLMAAHLMLIGRDASSEERQRGSGRRGAGGVIAPVSFDPAQYDRIVGRLVAVLGLGHPDVVALATKRSGQALDALPPVASPPMLWRSWVLLVEASNVSPTLVPASIWLRSLHVLPLRPFLLWTPSDQTSAVSRRWMGDIASGLAAARDDEPSARATASSASGPRGEGVTQDRARRRLSETLLVPRAVVDRLAEGEEL